jgi:hypothetical protein
MHRYLIVVFLSAANLATALAQAPTTVLDGVYTTAQAERGDAAYAAACSGCHEGQDADGPELIGRAFLDRWREDTLEPLFTFIKTRMPGNLPGSLDERVYVDIVAHVLHANELPAGENELSADMVGSIQLVGVEGPRPLSNLTIVRAVGCLNLETNNTWALVRAGSPRPVRDRIVDGTTPEELKVSAAQPLGTQTFPLLSVTQRGASYAGQKVQIKGVLTRQNTVERINVKIPKPDSQLPIRSGCLGSWRLGIGSSGVSGGFLLDPSGKGGGMRAFVFSLFIGISAFVATHEISAQSASSQAAADKLDPAAVRAANNRFAGTWKLVSQETRDTKGQVVPPAPNTVGRLGYIAYDPSGYMGVTIQSPERAKFAGRQPTPQEARAAISTYTSYWGSFAVDEAASIVTHQTFGALNTAMSGTNQVRGFTISGNRLTLRPPTAANGDQRSLTWERLPDLPNLTPTHRKLIGFWKLISLERRNAKGELLSSNPGQTGFIVYTASGHVMVHMMQPYRRRNVGSSPTPEETMAAYRSYTSYFGPYTVNESEKSVVHHLAGAINSGMVGTDFQRFFELSGKRLILKPPVTKNGNGEEVHSAITWERLSE